MSPVRLESVSFWKGQGDGSGPMGVVGPAQPIVVILAEDGRILFVNEAWSSFCLGSQDPSPDAWVGRSFLDIAREAQVEEGGEGLLVFSGLRDLLAGKRKRFEIVYCCDRGEQPRWFKLLCRSVTNSPEVAAVVMLVDVTESFLGEQSVRESEQRLCTLIEEADSGNGGDALDGKAIEAVLAATPDRTQADGRPQVRLSPREKECLLWTSYGLRSKEIADKLGITTKTVEHHLAKAKHKLGSKNRVEAVTRAIALRLIQP